MSKRFFSADFHFGMARILQFEERPFSDIEEHDTILVKRINDIAAKDDVIIHLGDLYSFGIDKGMKSRDDTPTEFLNRINATVINIRGNHDVNNKVKSLCNSMQTCLGVRFPNVTCGHYPSYDIRSNSYVKSGYINLHGHVHRKFKHCLDLDKQILNINVGIDVWNYNIVSEEELIRYINSLLTKKPNELYRCKTTNGKLLFFGG